MTAATGQQLDMLHGPIWTKIPQFALPVAATAILGQLFNSADIAIVGNFTGEMRNAAIAAVGANSAIIGLVINLFVGLSLGANVVIAHAIGEGDDEGVQKAVHTSIVMSVLGGLAVAILGQFIAAPLMGMLHVPEDVYSLALLYLRIYLSGLPVILLYNFEAAIFRSVGETRMPLLALALSGVLNVILNLIFVAVLHMTVEGVAIATVIANAVSAAILFWQLMRTHLPIRMDPRKLGIDQVSLKRILRIGLPAGIQTAIFSLANIVIQSAINSLGTVIMAASSAAFNIEIITYHILNSFSQACTTFVGQNFGAGKLDRCKKTLWLSMAEGVLVLVTAILLVLTIGKPMLAIFNRDPEVIALGYTRVMVLTMSHLFSLFYEILSGYLRGFGISVPPAILTMLGVCGVRLSWVRWVFPRHETFISLLLAYPLSLSLTAVLMLAAVLYYRPSRRFAHMERKEEPAR